jgi:hypothetical protein
MHLLDPEAAQLTINSHIYEAVENALTCVFSRASIIYDKLVPYMFGKPEVPKLDEPPLSFLLFRDLETSEWTKNLVIESRGARARSTMS